MYILHYKVLYFISYFTLQYLLCTVRIQIHYYSPGCSYCSCYFYCLYHYNVSGFPRGFPLKKDQRTAKLYLFELCSCWYTRFVWVSNEYSIFFLFTFTLISNNRFRLGLFNRMGDENFFLY